MGWISDYDWVSPIFVCGGNITQTEADAICSWGPEPPLLAYSSALAWDVNRDYKYIPRDAYDWENERHYSYLRFSCPEEASNGRECDFDVDGPEDDCYAESLLVIWCDDGDGDESNHLSLSLGGAEAEMSLNDVKVKRIFEE